MRRRLASIAAGLCAMAVLARAQASPTLTILSPPPDTYVIGPLVLRAQLTPPGTRVEHVTFFVDGQSLCVVVRPPFECAWDAGEIVREHAIRVVAALPDGTRVVSTVRTRGAGYVESVDVDAVQVTVTVTDRDGRLVRGLPRDAFRVREDGVLQAVSAFSNEHIPLEIVVALDVSHSMTAAMPVLKQAARSFLAALRPSDQVTLLAFNDNIFTLARRSTDTEARLRAVDRLAPWGGTALYDVLLTGLTVVGKQPGRRSLVAFTDGEDQSSVATLARVEARMETSDATVYTIGLGRGAVDTGLKDILARLARRSGGRAFLTERIDRLEKAFAEIIDELSSQYLLAYMPTNQQHDGTWRRIDVEVTGGRYEVRAREGYRAAKGKS